MGCYWIYGILWDGLLWDIMAYGISLDTMG